VLPHASALFCSTRSLRERAVAALLFALPLLPYRARCCLGSYRRARAAPLFILFSTRPTFFIIQYQNMDMILTKEKLNG
jgi:hypothetical protein